MPEERIEHVLEYVEPSERVVVSANFADRIIVAKVRFRSPTYTRRPVQYLNSSVLAVSLAQASQLLFDHYVGSPDFPFSHLLNLTELQEARLNHEVYYVDLQMRFRKRQPDTDYEIRIELQRILHFRGCIFGALRFDVEDKVRGTFKAFVPVHGISKEIEE